MTPRCAALVLTVVLSAAPLEAADAARAAEMLERGRTLQSAEALIEAKTLFAACLRERPGDGACGYSFARASLYLAEVYRLGRKSNEAAQELEAGIEQLQKTLGQTETASAHSLLADLYGESIAVHGGLSGMRYGPKITSENRRAMELDANDANVYASLGRQYLNTPARFGGDVKRAISAFEQSLRINPNSDETLVWLAVAFRKVGNQSGFEEAIRKALQLNPDSVVAKRVRDGR
jgi:tetratricopeptide (TPR) repeat protein